MWTGRVPLVGSVLWRLETTRTVKPWNLSVRERIKLTHFLTLSFVVKAHFIEYRLCAGWVLGLHWRHNGCEAKSSFCLQETPQPRLKIDIKHKYLMN